MKKRSFASHLYELLSSMRFAVSLLSVLAIASVIGTVLKQNEPYPNYLIEFGQFWFDAWRVLGLYDVYHAPWFLIILGFLVLSTSLCIFRHTPGFLREMKGYREKAKRRSLLSMPHHAVWAVTEQTDTLVPRAEAVLAGLGYRSKIGQDGDARLVAAKKGNWQRLGYFFAHAAIVMICIGGLIDGNLPYQIQNWLGLKRAETRDLPQSQVPPQSRLSSSNLSFRGNVTLAEGKAADVVFLNEGRGYLVQELPFFVELKRFYVEHYSTGQPKRFASDIVVTEKATGRRIRRTIEVNKPLTVAGVTIYQASFGDGGSPVSLNIWTDGAAQALNSVSQKTERIDLFGKPYALELGEFRLFNIEPMANARETDAFDRAMTVRQPKQVQNVGPSLTYKLRDASGQAKEFQSYMAPIRIEENLYWVTGMRSQPGEPFRYLRVPLGGEVAPQPFMRLRAEFGREETLERGADILADQMLSPQAAAALREPFRQSVIKVVATFAESGFPGLEKLVDERVPNAQRSIMLETNLKILMAFAWQAELAAAARAGVPAPAWDERHGRYLVDALQAMSDWRLMGIPALVEMTSFTDVKSSGLQLTRSPGKSLVYLGSLLLVLGALIMFYLHERRLWLRIAPGEIVLAMSANRKNAAFEREFAHLQTHLPQWLKETIDDKRS